MRQLKRRKCKLRNHKCSREEVKKRRNHKCSREEVKKRKNRIQLKNKNRWKPFHQQR
jgi:hypothetical protein